MDKFLRDHALRTTDVMDLRVLQQQLAKIEYDVTWSERIQDRIFDSIDEGGEEEEEAEFAEHNQRMTDIRNGLLDLISSVQIIQRRHKLRESMTVFEHRPSLSGCGVQQSLLEVKTALADLREQSRLLKEREEVTDLMDALKKSYSDFRERCEEDNTPDTLAANPKPKSSYGTVRLPRLELPTFHGDQSKWRPFWEKFNNALSKEPSLSDADKLHFLSMSIKNQEGRDIIDTGCRGGADYNNTVQILKERYDIPREMCRIVFQQFLQHAMEMTAEGIGKTITLLQKMLATLKECSSFTVETLYTIIMELKMPDIMFQHWTEETSTKKQPPPATNLIDYLRRY